jgi:hypothetical protein
MVRINQDRGICLIAQKRWGKTTLMRAILPAISQKIPVIIYNTNHEDWSEITGPRIIVAEPSMLQADDINYLSRKIKEFRAAMNNFCLYIIDVDTFFDGRGTNTTAADELRKLWANGGHQRILPVIETKAPKYIPHRIVDNCNLFYIGGFRDKDNLDRLKSYASKDEIRRLDRYQFIEVDAWTGKRAVVQIVDGEFITVRELPDMGESL